MHSFCEGPTGQKGDRGEAGIPGNNGSPGEKGENGSAGNFYFFLCKSHYELTDWQVLKVLLDKKEILE